MKDFILNLFSDSGTVSMMRLLSLICTITASGIAIHAVSKGSNLSEASILCSTFLAAGISGKVIQKQIENGKQN